MNGLFDRLRRLLGVHAARRTDSGQFTMCRCDLCEHAFKVLDREKAKWQLKRKLGA
jgi:hypothetical protein